MICFNCNSIMEYSYTIHGRGRHIKKIYICPKCGNMRYERGKIISNKTKKRF